MKRIFRSPTPRRAMAGVSLIELMTALTIGLLILVGLTSVFVNSSNSNRELKNTAEQIESGRYSIEFLAQDIRHAGYYGELSTMPTVPSTAPDPCAAPTAGTLDLTPPVAAGTSTTSPLGLPIQYISSASIPSGCSSLLTAANLAPNSDIVVVRRTDTNRIGITSAASGTIVANTVYLQTMPYVLSIQYGVAGSYTGIKDATGSDSPINLQRPDTSVAAVGSPAIFPLTSASVRQLRTHIYFVAPCSVGKGASGQCTGASGEDTIPTLKRLEMGTSGAFSIAAISEGIQAIRIEYGVDDTPTTADVNTGLVGDGVPDSYVNAPSLAQMSNIVAARIYVLARNTNLTRGYVDDKTYTLGTYTTTATNDQYKRHVYGVETRIVNQAGRKEIPQ
jgi:type IV pilus assembly protein PilW